MAGINALTHVVHLCEARLLLLKEKYEEEYQKLQSVRNAAPYGEYNFNQSLIDLEIESPGIDLNQMKPDRLIRSGTLTRLTLTNKCLLLG